MMQRTLDGRLIPLSDAEALRKTSPVSVYTFLVEFYAENGEVWERVKLENRDIDSRSVDERAILAAYHQSPHDDIRTYKVTRFEETDGSYTDEWRVEEFLNY